jgi:hypothetical protein
LPGPAGIAVELNLTAPLPQRAAAPIVPTIKTLDKVLIYVATVTSLAAVGGVVWVFLTLKNVLENFSS